MPARLALGAALVMAAFLFPLAYTVAAVLVSVAATYSTPETS